MQKHIEIIERMMFAMANHTVDGKRIYPTLKAAKEALEKQLPKKPILKYHKEDVTPVKYGRLIEFMCPNCGRFIVAMYEADVERGGGIHEDLKGCSTCLQAIDFTGYYHIDKLNEEIDFKE